jgi:hypothetical protein
MNYFDCLLLQTNVFFINKTRHNAYLEHYDGLYECFDDFCEVIDGFSEYF